MKQSNKDYIELGKQLAALFEYGAPTRKAILWSSFLRGIAQGFGAVVGGTLLVAFLLWVLGLFNHVPLLGTASDAISRSIHQ